MRERRDAGAGGGGRAHLGGGPSQRARVLSGRLWYSVGERRQALALRPTRFANRSATARRRFASRVVRARPAGAASERLSSRCRERSSPQSSRIEGDGHAIGLTTMVVPTKPVRVEARQGEEHARSTRYDEDGDEEAGRRRWSWRWWRLWWRWRYRSRWRWWRWRWRRWRWPASPELSRRGNGGAHGAHAPIRAEQSQTTGTRRGTRRQTSTTAATNPAA